MYKHGIFMYGAPWQSRANDMVVMFMKAENNCISYMDHKGNTYKETVQEFLSRFKVHPA
jgi:hypothetical protein